MGCWPALAENSGEVSDARVLTGLLASLDQNGHTRTSTAKLVVQFGLSNVDPDSLAHRFVQLGYFEAGSGSSDLGSKSLTATPAGEKAASEFAAARGRISMARAVRSLLLYWLYEANDSRRPHATEFLSRPFSWFYGTQFIPEQVTAAARNLRDRGFIEASGTAQSDLLGLQLTARGIRCVEAFNSDPDALEHPTPDLPPRTRSQMTRTPSVPTSAAGKQTVFLVHGHDEALKYEVARFIERTLDEGVSVVILHEEPNAGRTLIEKFEGHAASASYAVVLLTPDDQGGKRGGTLRDRARQNVVFELGYFFGQLGRNRVAAINKGVETPSDIAGVTYIPYDGQWKEELRRELHAAGLPTRT